MKRSMYKISGKARVAVYVAGLSVMCSCAMRTRFNTPEEKLVAYNWTLHAYQGHAISLQGFPKGAPILRFYEDSTLDLFTGCEHRKGIYTMNDYMFDIEIDTQRVSCQIPSTENLIRLLNLSNAYVFNKEKLSIRLNGSEVLSFFEK